MVHSSLTLNMNRQSRREIINVNFFILAQHSLLILTFVSKVSFCLCALLSVLHNFDFLKLFGKNNAHRARLSYLNNKCVHFQEKGDSSFLTQNKNKIFLMKNVAAKQSTLSEMKYSINNNST